MKIQTDKLRRFVLNDLNLDLFGVAKPTKLEKEFTHFQKASEQGLLGEMKWLKQSGETRSDPYKLLNNCQSIIVVGANYYQNNPYRDNNSIDLPRIFYDKNLDRALIARYTWGLDYRKVIKKKLKEMQKYLLSVFPDSKSYIAVDSEPIFEKAWAVRAGIGWQGKNSIIINPEIGSWFVIGILLTSAELQHSEPLEDLCGDCKICLEACPTKAIINPKLIDARKCISYQTIEEPRNSQTTVPITVNGWGFGCDICQEVCPHNIKNAVNTRISEFKALKSSADPKLSYWSNLLRDPEQFKSIYAESSLRRRKCVVSD